MTTPAEASAGSRGATGDRSLRHRELATYLNDHLAGAEAGRRLASRLARTVAEPELSGIDTEIDRDHAALRRIMHDLDVPRSRLKQVAGGAAEMAGRIKLRLGSAGAREVEQLLGLEAMAVGVAGRLRLWRSLELLASAEQAWTRTSSGPRGPGGRSARDDRAGPAPCRPTLPGRRMSVRSAAGS
jgi:hypothetical protein